MLFLNIYLLHTWKPPNQTNYLQTMFVLGMIPATYRCKQCFITEPYGSLMEIGLGFGKGIVQKIRYLNAYEALFNLGKY